MEREPKAPDHVPKIPPCFTKLAEFLASKEIATIEGIFRMAGGAKSTKSLVEKMETGTCISYDRI